MATKAQLATRRARERGKRDYLRIAGGAAVGPAVTGYMRSKGQMPHAAFGVDTDTAIAVVGVLMGMRSSSRLAGWLGGVGIGHLAVVSRLKGLQKGSGG